MQTANARPGKIPINLRSYECVIGFFRFSSIFAGMNQIKVNQNFAFQAVLGNQPMLNGEPVLFDWQSSGNGEFHVLLNNRSFRARLVNRNKAQHTATFEIEGELFEVKVLDQFDELVDKMGINLSVAQVKDLKAPMPGLVLKIDVQPGDVVEKDQPLLILEAMKMENVLKSPAAGTISSIEVTAGDKVDKNQVLLRFA